MVNDDLNAIRDAVGRATGRPDARAPERQPRIAQPTARPQQQRSRPALIVLSVLVLLIAGVGGGILMLIGSGQATMSEISTGPAQIPDGPFISAVDTDVPGVTPTETSTPLPTNTEEPARTPPTQQQQLLPAQAHPPASPQPADQTEKPPEIFRVETYREGVLVYFRLFFNDPNGNAQGLDSAALMDLAGQRKLTLSQTRLMVAFFQGELNILLIMAAAQNPKLNQI